MPNFLFTWVDTFDYDPMRLLGRPVQEFFFFGPQESCFGSNMNSFSPLKPYAFCTIK